jgi:CheY-like chemotaxis protein
VAELGGGEGTVLVVDDEAVVQRTLKTALEKYGYTVLMAGGGEEAIAILRQMRSQIALVLLDMAMPVMSGRKRSGACGRSGAMFQ